MADKTSVLLNVGEMIDLAIGTPEIGCVDFGMLQAVLHCLAQQMRVSGKNVELQGSVAALPNGRSKGHTIAVTEFIVDTDEKDPQEKIMKNEVVPLQLPANDKETILVVERKKIPRLTSSSPRRTQSPRKAGETERQAAREISSSEKLSLVTISKFNILENTVEDLKNRVYGSIPKNEDILGEVRSQTNLKAISDMWTSLNVSSRLEAAEAGIAKLSSLVQDVITDTAGMQDVMKSHPSITPSSVLAQSTILPPTADTAPSTVTTPSNIKPPSIITASTPDAEPEGGQQPNVTFDEQSILGDKSLQGQLDRLRRDLENLTNNVYTAVGDQIKSGRRNSEPPQELSSALISELMERVNNIEKRLKECCDSVGKNDGVIQDQINSFQDQLEYLIKQVATLTNELGANTISPDVSKDLQGLLTLFQTVQEIQEQLKQVHDTALQLASEKEDRQYHTNALLEQIELLKTIKLDREDMVEAMAEKADMRMLARKVSHDQFEIACDDLSRGLEHALGKLNMQEALWQQALDDIQREIETKLDKMEMNPVKDFFNTKLKQLQENLKQMASLRREAEAAGTKRRLLRDVNCISCDANAVMQTEPPSTVPVLRPLPPNLSMKPYLSYELDTIRKTQATKIPQRNMHDWENIEKQMAQTKQPQKIRSDTGKHICNRYCGGSHTVTTASQRVARVGHFIKQWGPDVVPLSSGLAAGDDGRLYKVTVEDGETAGTGKPVETCTPKIQKMESKEPRPQKSITSECRCLEEDQHS